MGINLFKVFNIIGVNVFVSWLFFFIDGGWGLFIILFILFIIMSIFDVLIILLVFEVFLDMVDEVKFKFYFDWFFVQRFEDGFWGYYKKSVNIFGQVLMVFLLIEYIVRVFELFIEYGYDLNYFDMVSMLFQGIKNSNRIVEKVLVFKFVMELGFLLFVFILFVVSKLGSGIWYIYYSLDYVFVVEKFSGIIEFFGGVLFFKEGDMGREFMGNYIFVGLFGSFDISVYNFYVNIFVVGNYVEING